MLVGNRVKIWRIDPEDGFPFSNDGTVIFDHEELYNKKEIDVRLDNGEIVRSISKLEIDMIHNEENNNEDLTKNEYFGDCEELLRKYGPERAYELANYLKILADKDVNDALNER